MNRLLANAMGVLNFVVGVVLVGGGTTLGASSGSFLSWLAGTPMNDLPEIGTAVGFAVGLLSAIVVCGSLAVLISIYEVLKKIHKKQIQQAD